MMEVERRDITPPMHKDRKKLAFTLHNVFTPEECARLIDLSEEGGYERALVNVGTGEVEMTDVRNNYRWMEDNEERAQWMFERIREHLPLKWRGRHLSSLNERLRYLRYDPGQKFEPHLDGCYMRTTGPRRGETSFITIQIYLNEGFVGGTTRFVDEHSDDYHDVVPETGSVLVFQHDILHQGSELVEGRKYTIRTDVMYSKSPDTVPLS